MPVKSEQPPQQQPPYLFRNAAGLVRLTQQHNVCSPSSSLTLAYADSTSCPQLTIAQLCALLLGFETQVRLTDPVRRVWQNERAFLSDSEISNKLLNLWRVMDASIHSGVSSTEPELPGRLRVRRRAPHLYRRLFKGFYPSLLPSSADTNASLPPPSADQPLTLAHGFNFSAPPPASRTNGAPLVVGSFEHPLPPTPRTKGQFPAIDWLSCYAIAVNETNASGGRVVTAPTNVSCATATVG